MDYYLIYLIAFIYLTSLCIAFSRTHIGLLSPHCICHQLFSILENTHSFSIYIHYSYFDTLSFLMGWCPVSCIYFFISQLYYVAMVVL